MAIASNLGLELATVSNFFMNARRRSMDKWADQNGGMGAGGGTGGYDARGSPFSDLNDTPAIGYYENHDAGLPTPAHQPPTQQQQPAYAMPTQLNHLGNVKAEPTVSF